MRWDRSYRSSNVEDRRGHRASGPGAGGAPLGGIVRLVAAFGWKGLLVGLVIAILISGGQFCDGRERDATGRRPIATSPDEDELVRFVGFVFDDAQQLWRDHLPRYETAKLVLFRRGVRSACGSASTAIGPFYCPLDRKVYIDLAFYDQLRARFGAPGDFAQAYVIAHEVAHHVQNLTGKLGRGAPDSITVELQADCLAGAWARDADRRGLLEHGDLDEALTAAAAIGDDTLQRKARGTIQPETWTHGSAAQRRAAFEKGYKSGPGGCGL
jgi:uncharacterized protein